MLTVHVYFKVKPEKVDDFKAATLDNVINSRKESGVIQFDMLQQQEDRTKFTLCETYFSPEDQLKHRETAHYKKWRKTVLDLLSEPYSFIKYDYIEISEE